MRNVASRVPVVRTDTTGTTPAEPQWLKASLGRFDQRRATAVIVVLGAVIAWSVRWTQDDAYISLRYARNLARGHGLVYNLEEYVEGYTNFLWTVVLAVPLRLGLDPVEVGHALGVLCMVGTVLITVNIGTRVLGSRLLGNAAAIVLVLNPTFIAYATGGLETALQTVLVAAVMSLALPGVGGGRPGTARLALMSLLAGLAVLTRMDSVVALAVPGLLALWWIVRPQDPEGTPLTGGSERRRVQFDAAVVPRIAALVVPALCLIIPWMLWRRGYYGEWVPNTAVAKRTELVSFVRGGVYLALYGILSASILFVVPVWRNRQQLWAVRGLRPLVWAVGLWLTYVLFVGADFMEFRFLVVVMPAAAIVVAAVLMVASRPWRIVLIAALLLAVPARSVYFYSVQPWIPTGGNIEGVGHLSSRIGDDPESWGGLGKRLGAELASPDTGSEGDVVIAVTPAGALPYESELRTVDMLGLTDPWTARNGVDVPQRVPKAGHERITTAAHLVRSGVALVVGHPQVRPPAPANTVYGRAAVDEIFLLEVPDPEALPEDVSMVEMPVDGGNVLRMLYLQRHPRVDELLASGRWSEVPVQISR